MQLEYFHKLDSFWGLIKHYDTLFIEQMDVESLDSKLSD